MSLKHTISANLPKPPDFKGNTIEEVLDKLGRYLQDVNRAMTRMSDNIYHDLRLGQTRLQVYTSAPTIATMDIGQLGLHFSGVSAYVFTRMSGSIYFQKLTKV
ncbi:MAG: hypothetical protein ABIG61_07315 [Planctomycetota bacterium]